MDKRQYRMAADWAASAYEAWRDLGALGTFRDWVSDGVGVPAVDIQLELRVILIAS